MYIEKNDSILIKVSSLEWIHTNDSIIKSAVTNSECELGY